MKKTVFFDLGNVVLFFNHQKMCRQIAEYCNLKEEQIRDTLLHSDLAAQYESGVINSRDVYHTLYPEGNGSVHFSGVMKAISDIFQVNDSILPIIKQLREQSISLYILSNTCEAHFSYAYTHYPVLHLFDGYILSYEVKARKPDPKIYLHALEKAGCSKEHCFYIDDVEEYVQGARNLGIDAEQYINSELLLEHLQQRHFLPRLQE